MMMLSSNEESRTHDTCVVSIKQEPNDDVDWIIEQNIHSDDEEDDDSSHMNDRQDLFLKQEDKESDTVSLGSPTSKLKWNWKSKQKANLSKVIRFNSLIEDLKRKSLAKQKDTAETASDSIVKHNIEIECSVSKDVSEDKDCGVTIKQECCATNENSDDRLYAGSCPKQDSLQFVSKNKSSHCLPKAVPNIKESTTNSNHQHLTLRNLLTHVPVTDIGCSISTSTILPKEKTFSNKAWLPKLRNLIRSKPKSYSQSEDNQVSERSGDGEKQEFQPKLLTTQTLSSMLKPDENEVDSEQQFTCEECNKSFSTFPSLVAHKKFHRMRKKLVCTTCQKEFTIRREYDRHVKKHKERVEPVCPVCNKTFSVIGSMKRHMIIHRKRPTGEDRFYADDLCGEGLEKCPVCNKVYSKYYIKQHMNIHSTNKLHVCILCGKTFTHKQSLEAHKLKHKHELAMWNCEVCDQKFDYEYLLKRHMKLHTKYQCEKCGKTLRNRASYASHWRTHNSFSYCCHVCNRTYSRYSAYFSHYQTHKNADREPLPENTGDASNESFTQIDQGNGDSAGTDNSNEKMDFQDTTTEHTVENDSLTNVTSDNAYDSSDTSRSGDNIQYSGSHSIPKSDLVCHLCKWDASSQRALKRHLLIHQPNPEEVNNIKADLIKMCKEGVVQCPVCEEKFSRYYIRHHIKIHSKDRPFACKMCDKSFVHKTGLAAHVHGHQKQQVWSCDLCEQSFNEQYLLKCHMETHGSSDTTTSQKPADFPAENSNYLTSTCPPEPSIDNGSEEIDSKPVFDIEENTDKP